MINAQTIVQTLLEADDDLSLDPEDIMGGAADLAEIERDRRPSEIRGLVPEFFSRKNNRIFGTRRTRFFKGNWAVLTNVRTLAGGMRSTEHVLYQLVYYKDRDEWDMMWRGDFRNFDTLKEYIREVRSNPSLTVDEFKKQYGTGGLEHLL